MPDIDYIANNLEYVKDNFDADWNVVYKEACAGDLQDVIDFLFENKLVDVDKISDYRGNNRFMQLIREKRENEAITYLETKQ